MKKLVVLFLSTAIQTQSFAASETEIPQTKKNTPIEKISNLVKAAIGDVYGLVKAATGDGYREALEKKYANQQLIYANQQLILGTNRERVDCLQEKVYKNKLNEVSAKKDGGVIAQPKGEESTTRSHTEEFNKYKSDMLKEWDIIDKITPPSSQHANEWHNTEEVTVGENTLTKINLLYTPNTLTTNKRYEKIDHWIETYKNLPENIKKTTKPWSGFRSYDYISQAHPKVITTYIEALADDPKKESSRIKGSLKSYLKYIENESLDAEDGWDTSIRD